MHLQGKGNSDIAHSRSGEGIFQSEFPFGKDPESCIPAAGGLRAKYVERPLPRLEPEFISMKQIYLLKIASCFFLPR